MANDSSRTTGRHFYSFAIKRWICPGREAEPPVTETFNPYQPPPSVEAPESRWHRILRGLSRKISLRDRRFANGWPVIFDGVVFFVEARDRTTLHAAVPSSEISEARMQRNVAEAVRLLPEFVLDQPSHRAAIRGCRLVVRMIHRYADLDQELYPRVDVRSEVVETAVESDTDPHEAQLAEDLENDSARGRYRGPGLYFAGGGLLAGIAAFSLLVGHNLSGFSIVMLGCIVVGGICLRIRARR